MGIELVRLDHSQLSADSEKWPQLVVFRERRRQHTSSLPGSQWLFCQGFRYSRRLRPHGNAASGCSGLQNAVSAYW